MRCVPDAPVLGEACDDGAACAQGECERGVCTALCGSERTCPVGHDCVREGVDTVCRPRATESGGGCAVSAGARGHRALPMLVLAGLALAIGARRRR